jgi:hypothetical protein
MIIYLTHTILCLDSKAVDKLSKLTRVYAKDYSCFHNNTRNHLIKIYFDCLIDFSMQL